MNRLVYICAGIQSWFSCQGEDVWQRYLVSTLACATTLWLIFLMID